MKLLKQIETLFQAGTAGGLSDGQLLDRFVARRDETAETAFAALVDRHGAMVLRVCRQVLGDEHEAQDASQATFLVLARRAGSIGRRESVASWLHGVALRVAARARLAASRRRARELRGREKMAARHSIEVEPEADDGHERWSKLHDELGRLPDSFRQPLVLCYLEGMTQEQAAVQLRCPLGTVQSRLARGRAKLKARLTKRGFDRSDAFPGVLLGTQVPTSPPEIWAEATVRLAMQFTQTNGPGVVGIVSAAALAEDVLRAMVLTKVKVALGIILFAAVLISGAGTWAQQQAKRGPIVLAARVDIPTKIAEAERIPEKFAAPPESVTRTIRGVVKDEQGRPMAKVWLGRAVEWSPGTWRIIQPLDRIRETKAPFRDEQGNVAPAGPLGKYYELRDKLGRTWQAIHPDKIQRFDRSLNSVPSPFDASPFEGGVEFPNDAIAKDQIVYQVRTTRGRWQMLPLSLSVSDFATADRTDERGHFEVEVTTYGPSRSTAVYFASPDFMRQAVHVVRNEDPDRPLEIPLRPVRLVRARVIETPVDDPADYLLCFVYAFDPLGRNAEYIDAMRDKGVSWSPASTLSGSRNQPRQLQVALIAGRYRFRFVSNRLVRLVDVVVPAGDGPLELPDFQLETLASVKMFGRQAAEIESVDLEGKPVKLADYRGKVVVLAFWASDGAESPEDILRLNEIKKRFKDQPLAILALHDASLTSLMKYREALKPLRKQVAGEVPIRFLLDRPPIGAGTGPYALKAGEQGSGRTRDTYESVTEPAIYVVDKNGKLVYGFRGDLVGRAMLSIYIGKDGQVVHEEIETKLTAEHKIDRNSEIYSLEGALEDQLGLPRSHPAEPIVNDPISRPDLEPKISLVLKGKVVDLEGRPIAGATVLEVSDYHRNEIAKLFKEPEVAQIEGVKTGPAGDFHYTFKDHIPSIQITIEAPGFVARELEFTYSAEGKPQDSIPNGVGPSGVIAEPLVIGPGAKVTGRLLHKGKPVAGVSMHLEDRSSFKTFPHGPFAAKTDDQGSFCFPHVFPNCEFSAYVEAGSLKDGATVVPQHFRSGEHGSETLLGDLDVRPGLTLAGKVVFSDGRGPAKVYVVVMPEHAGSAGAIIDGQGRFEFRGLPEGPVTVDLNLGGHKSAETNYHLSPKNKCLNPTLPEYLMGRLDRDITDLTILVESGMAPRFTPRMDLDPAVLADFNDAKRGPIAGVPAKDFAKGH